jgi:acetylornithine deacetylase
LIRLPSTSGQELEEIEFLSGAFGALGADVEKVAMSDDILKDPDYSDPIPDLRYDGRFNLRVKRRGAGGGRTVAFNTHTDVVPPSEGMEDAYNPRVEDGVVFGRGACDAKGQVVTAFLVLKALDELGVTLNGDVIAHLVVEEENGGNGTLAMIREGVEADACIVLEPTAGKLMTSIRGAVWFRLVLSGKAGHSGAAGRSRSALLMARDAIAILEKYHADLLAASRGLPLFDPNPNPMPITFGRLQAGNWPSTAPSRALLEGVLGLLPNKTKEQVCEEMRQALIEGGDEFLAQNFELSFMYRHDSSVLDTGHELPQGLLKAAKEAGVSLELGGMPASCDAWFYNNQLGIPTVVCGPGALGVAHSKDEQIDMQEVAGAAEVIVRFLIEYCGTSE